jgi:Ca-activated chloride channel family protein
MISRLLSNLFAPFFSFRFANWPFLLLLVVLPLLHRWWKKRNQPPKVTFSLPVPEGASVSDPTRALLILKYVGWVLFVVALARPQTSYKQTERTVSGVDITLVLDVSASMNIEDLSDQSRLAIAKQTMENFIRGRPNDRIGFVQFSGEPLTLAPPTLDHGLLLRSIEDIRTGILRDGTAIGDGLSLAISHLRNSKAKSRVIILLTDGDNNFGQVDPATAGEIAKGFGLKVYTIAIGREGRVKMPIRSKTPFGGDIVSYQWFDNALNPELLEKIAAMTEGKFYRVTDAGALEQVFREIDRMEKTEIRSTERVRYDEHFSKPLRWGLLVLLLEQLVSLIWVRGLL